MARTPAWEKKLGGHAGELYVAAELSKRGIPNALLPENFTGDDLMAGAKDSDRLCFVQVKSCHPSRASSFILRESEESWTQAPDNEFVVFVWLGKPDSFESPRYWIATKREVGQACVAHSAHGTKNWERRFHLTDLPPEWENRWSVFDPYRPKARAG
jgi:hypothetical protein